MEVVFDWQKKEGVFVILFDQKNKIKTKVCFLLGEKVFVYIIVFEKVHEIMTFQSLVRILKNNYRDYVFIRK